MRALITAGGRGTRLRPITYTLNKHLVPICNEPLLMRSIRNAAEVGIQEIIININAGDEEIPAVIGDGEKWGVNIRYVEQHEPRGLAHVLLLAKEYLQDDTFVFYYGDNVLAGGLQQHVDAFKKAGSNCHLCLSRVEHPEQFGVAVVDGDRVKTTVEKPKEFISDLAITGLQFYDQEIFEAIKHIKPTPPKPPRTIAEMDIPPANQWLIDQGYHVSYSIITDWWKDTGKPQDMIEANKLIMDEQQENIQGVVDSESKVDGVLALGKNSKVVNSKIVGPVVIGDDCLIENSTVGPYCSIASGTTVKQSEVRESIILQNGMLEGVPGLEQSILGQSVQIREGSGGRQQLLVGDNGFVRL